MHICWGGCPGTCPRLTACLQAGVVLRGAYLEQVLHLILWGAGERKELPPKSMNRDSCVRGFSAQGQAVLRVAWRAGWQDDGRSVAARRIMARTSRLSRRGGLPASFRDFSEPNAVASSAPAWYPEAWLLLSRGTVANRREIGWVAGPHKG